MDHKPLAMILAAGAGRRLATEILKPLLPLPSLPAGQDTFIERHVSLLSSLGVEAMAIVPATEIDAYRFLEKRGVVVIQNLFSPLKGGSTVSVRVGLEAALERAMLFERDLIIIDCDTVYEVRLMNSVVEAAGRSYLFVTDSYGGDDEEVCVYCEGETPRLIGKGLAGVAGLALQRIGESTGIIRVTKSDLQLLYSLVTWLTGAPPLGAAYGFSKEYSEHEEIWQYFFTLGAMSVFRLPPGIAFAECDTVEDHSHIVAHVLPLIRQRDGLDHSMIESGDGLACR